MIRKLLICPYFGTLPEWYYLWRQNIQRLADDGYDFLLDRDEQSFASRIERFLELKWPNHADARKACDYRCAFGELYADEIDGSDFWGHTDLDMVYGRVGEFLPDFVLEPLDIFSNHATYVSGPFSLYRNTPVVNSLFREVEDWQGYLTNPTTNGWVETAFSREVDKAHDEGRIVRRYESWQTRNLDSFDTVRFDEQGRLVEGNREIMVAHFRRNKVYPAGCK